MLPLFDGDIAVVPTLDVLEQGLSRGTVFGAAHADVVHIILFDDVGVATQLVQPGGETGGSGGRGRILQ